MGSFVACLDGDGMGREVVRADVWMDLGEVYLLGEGGEDGRFRWKPYR